MIRFVQPWFWYSLVDMLCLHTCNWPLVLLYILQYPTTLRHFYIFIHTSIWNIWNSFHANWDGDRMNFYDQMWNRPIRCWISDKWSIHRYFKSKLILHQCIFQCNFSSNILVTLIYENTKIIKNLNKPLIYIWLLNTFCQSHINISLWKIRFLPSFA